jgi:hypothetical protein
VNLAWLENLTKPFSQLLNPLLERIGNRLGRRKPHLYVHVNVMQAIWCIAKNGDVEIMQAVFWAEFNHDDPKQTLVIMDAYPVGTRPQISATSKFSVGPGQIVTEQIGAYVLPIKGERGKPWSGRFILVDQFHRKHKTQKITLKWVGNSPASKG